MDPEATGSPATPAPSKKLLQTFTLADLKLNPPPEIEYIVPGIIPEGLSLLAAKTKVGKSFLALQLCLAVTAGKAFLGRPTKGGSALYLALEDGASRLFYRSHKLSEAEHVDESIHFAIEAAKLGDGLHEQLVEQLDSIDDLRLIVIDTMGEVLPATTSRSDYVQGVNVLRPLQRLALKRKVGILLIHHTNKNEDTADVFDQINGTTGYNGVADALLVMKRARHSNQASIEITGRDFEEASLQLEQRDLQWHVVGTPPEAALGLTPEKMSVLRAVLAGNHKTKEIAVVLDKGYKVTNKHANQLKEMGLLTSSSSGHYDLTEHTRKVLEESSGSSGTSGKQELTPTAAPSNHDLTSVDANDHGVVLNDSTNPSETSMGNASALPGGEVQVPTPLF